MKYAVAALHSAAIIIAASQMQPGISTLIALLLVLALTLAGCGLALFRRQY